MRKKLIAIISVLAVSVSLAACGESANTFPDAIEETVEETVENIVEEPQEEAIDETEEVVEEVIEEPNEVAEEVIEQSTTEEVEDKEVVTVEAEPAEVAYTYSDTSATMYAKSTVNVRDLPDKSGNKVGSLSQNQEIAVTGKCNETGWYRIEYNGSTAYVSNDFLVNEKVEVAPPVDNGGGQKASGSAKLSDQYAYDVWYDMGDYAFILKHEKDLNMNNLESDDAVAAALRARYPDYQICRKAGFPVVDGYVWYDYYWDGASGFGGNSFIRTYSVNH